MYHNFGEPDTSGKNDLNCPQIYIVWLGVWTDVTTHQHKKQGLNSFIQIYYTVQRYFLLSVLLLCRTVLPLTIQVKEMNKDQNMAFYTVQSASHRPVIVSICVNCHILVKKIQITYIYIPLLLVCVATSAFQESSQFWESPPKMKMLCSYAQ